MRRSVGLLDTGWTEGGGGSAEGGGRQRSTLTYRLLELGEEVRGGLLLCGVCALHRRDGGEHAGEGKVRLNPIGGHAGGSSDREVDGWGWWW
jgi:hypothetical protein